VLGDTAVTPNDFDLGSDNNIENGTETIYLVETANPAAITALLGTDVDGDDDLITDIVGLATIVDIIAMVDTGFGAGDLIYDGATPIGPDGSNFPAGIFRGEDAPSPWCEVVFLDFDDVANLAVPRTPGAFNSVCETPVVSYCTAGTTTNGCVATISASGIASVTAGSGFDVTVSSVEGSTFGLIYFGTTGRVAKPWAAGSTSFRCVKAPGNRTGNQMTGGTSGACDGTLSLDFNAWMAANPARAPLPGQTVNMQGFFRDPPAPRTTNLSDAIEFVVIP
jgi:hypothetical protein